jgi:hypothetical protein
MGPVRSADADEEKPFSELMLQWLEEGDKMADAPPDGARPHAPLAPASRVDLGGVFKRDRALIAGATLIAAVAVLVLRLVGSSAPAAPPEVASGPPPRELAQPVPAAGPQARVANVIVGEPSFTMVPHKNPPAARAPAVRVAAAGPAPSAAPMRAPSPSEQVSPAAAATSLGPAPAAVPAPEAAKVARAAAPPPPSVAAVPDFADAVSSCRSELAAGHVRSAVAACHRAVDVRPGAPDALTLLAEAEYTRGRAREAMRLASAAVASDASFADAYVIIGSVNQDLGKLEDARAAYRRYLTLAPRGAHAAELRALLASR